MLHRHPAFATDVLSFDSWMEQDEAEAAVALLGQLGGGPAESILLRLVGQSRDEELLASVVIALGQCGGLSAVEPLLRLEERGGSLGREARFSIEQIQQRRGAHARGGLALAGEESEVGGLSVAGGEGELALAEE